MAFTGMRIRETLALRWQDIDSEKGLIWVTEQLDEDSGTRIAVKTRYQETFQLAEAAVN